MLWLLEPDVYAVGTHPLQAAAREAGHRVRLWDDGWWSSQAFPSLDGPVLFHGSLGNAARVAELGRWTPGAFCNTAGFHCSAWYRAAKTWLVHQDFTATTVAQLVSNPDEVAGSLADSSGEVFVRPDSPLKPFSGRVVNLHGLTAAHLDHGFYYDDIELPVIVSRKLRLGAEWRFVIADRSVVTGCRYEAGRRKAAGSDVEPAAVQLAQVIAREFQAPDPVFILDIVEGEDGLKMVEINPFSGADLYACDKARIVAKLAAAVAG